jgi:hypothetical protein
MKITKQFIKEEKGILITLSVIFLLIIFTIVDITFSNQYTFNGKIVDRKNVEYYIYDPITSKYNDNIYIQRNLTRVDEYVLIVKNKKGEIVFVNSSYQSYYTKKDGSELTYKIKYGLITKIPYVTYSVE